MVRTIISMEDDDKRWLDEHAAAEGVPMTEIVRRPIRRYRDDTSRADFDAVLDRAVGLWTEGDGLAWQLKMRAGWHDRRP